MADTKTSKRIPILITGMLVSLLGVALIVGAAGAETVPQPRMQGTTTPEASITPAAGELTATGEPLPQKACIECHPDKKAAWMDSPHANAALDPVFLEGWENMERPSDCLLCHQAAYDQESGDYLAQGVTCETCHGAVGADHPPAGAPTRSDEEYCGTCHPTTLGEARLSGHTTENEVRCVNCHDPHSQEVLFENPDDMCKDCHTEDLQTMEDNISGIHLQDEIACADCHMLDVPHTFLYNFQHEDTSVFFKGFDCTSEITESVALRAGTDHEALGKYVEDQMNWPVVHRISRLETAPQCSDCHVMNQELKQDLVAFGYTAEDVESMAWEKEDFPELTRQELTKLVATPKRSWNWIFWVIGVTAVVGMFEMTVSRRMNGKPAVDVKSLLRKIFAGRKNNNDQEKD